ncbi:hypothetical protein KIPB_007605, partial [Kipferlia bialata]
PAPHVDSSASNLLINSKGELRRKSTAGGNVVSLADCLDHALNKKFVSFIDYSHPKNANIQHRFVTKYFQRGWTCLSPNLPQSVLQAARGYRDLVQGEDRYNVDWTQLYSSNASNSSYSVTQSMNID